MEGLTDPLMRQVLTEPFGKARYDWAVSEFIRVNAHLLPEAVFYKAVPELKTGGMTLHGVPVHVQLLGSDAYFMAQNAARAVSCGAHAIDLNFGCPAKTVNRHQGGAVLLKSPDTIGNIVRQVRDVVPAHVPVSVKIRLGYDDAHALTRIAHTIKDAGASWLTVHARTKAQGYRPPAHWHELARLETLGIPLIANGDVFDRASAHICQIQAKTPHLMLGRGAVTAPDLIAQLKDTQHIPCEFVDFAPRIGVFLQADTTQGIKPLILLGRFKQWLGMMSLHYPDAKTLWQEVKSIRTLEGVHRLMNVWMQKTP